MINAVRTVLLNRGRDGAHYTSPGEEYVSPDFIPRRHPPELRRALSQLFGSSPDRLYLNYRLHQIMQVLHSTELEQYVYWLDRRVTYLPFKDVDFTAGVFGQTVETLNGAPELLIHGTHDVDDGLGVTTASWRLDVLNSTQVQVQRLSPPYSSHTVEYVDSGGLSSYIDLQGSQLRCKFRTQYAIGGGWLVTSRARPVEDLGLRFLRLQQTLDDRLLAAVFATRGEPWTTLWNSYQDNQLFPYQFSGLLLAFALYADTLPQDV